MAAAMTWYSSSDTINPGAALLYRVSCAPGESVTAGGFFDNDYSADVVTDSSGPLADLSGWSFHITNTDATTHSLSLWALCTTAPIAQAPAASAGQ
jgi:hypothetical protein